jgi:mono/diheme cytochrome c family protein
MKTRNALVSIMLFLCGVGIAHAQSNLFTEEQARRGEAAYSQNCVTCHGAELRPGDREVTPLTDKAFKAGWVGKTIAEKFEVTRDTMPPQEKGSLGDQVYLDIIAYILKFNKFPAGGQELKPDMSVLRQTMIPAPPE